MPHAGERADADNAVSLTVKRVFARNLLSLRQKKNFSQDYFANVSRIDRSFVSQLEREIRCPSLETVARVAHALGVTIAELVEGLDAAVFPQLAADSPERYLERKPYHGPPPKRDLAYLRALGGQAGLALKSRRYLGSKKAHVWVCAARHDVRTNTGNLKQRIIKGLAGCTQCARKGSA